jgi:hypothetical protein
MTETQWLLCIEPVRMLGFLRMQRSILQTKSGRRKVRLCLCAGCRRIAPQLPEVSEQALATCERYADGLAKRDDVKYARARCCQLYSGEVDNLESLGSFAYAVTHPSLPRAIEGLGQWWARKRAPAFEGGILAKTFREIIGNPYQAESSTVHYSISVIQLAKALYNRADCAFALHDALLEAGHNEVAEHFRESAHPKGCWALDLILGK